MRNREERCCGNCCWFKHEDIDGFGICYKKDMFPLSPNCSDDPCEEYVSNEEQRHYTAVLIQANRYRRDNHVPAIYRMPNPKELGKAIDFAVEYIKVFDKI
jgi:hypothetical protein